MSEKRGDSSKKIKWLNSKGKSSLEITLKDVKTNDEIEKKRGKELNMER